MTKEYTFKYHPEIVFCWLTRKQQKDLDKAKMRALFREMVKKKLSASYR